MGNWWVVVFVFGMCGDVFFVVVVVVVLVSVDLSLSIIFIMYEVYCNMEIYLVWFGVVRFVIVLVLLVVLGCVVDFFLEVEIVYVVGVREDDEELKVVGEM